MLVRAPDSTLIPATLLSIDDLTPGSPRTATYSINAPDGDWTEDDNGTYTVVAVAGQVADTSNNFVAPADIGTFSVSIDQTPPAGTATGAPDLSGPGGLTQTITIDYADNVAIDTSTLGSDDLIVTDPTGHTLAVTFVGVDNAANGTPRTATYTVPAPGGTWGQEDNGVYTIGIAPNAVADASGNFVLAVPNIDAWLVAIDQTPPAITARALSDFYAPGVADETIQIQFSDNVAIDVSTLDANDLIVTDPNDDPLAVTFVSVDISADGTPRTATYSVSPPGGAWGEEDNGVYQVAMAGGEVADASGNFVPAGALDSWLINIDQTAPFVMGASAADIAVPGGTSHSFTITYGDSFAIDATSLAGANVTVVAPDASELLATLIGVDMFGDATPRTATYSIPAPGGAWTTDDNGQYDIRVEPNQVSDTSGNFVPSGIVTHFTVAVDSVAPSASAAASAITTPGGADQTITVTLSDNVAIDVSTLDDSNISIVGPDNTPIAATLTGVDDNTNGTPRTVTFTIAAPGGSWDQGDNGAYTIDIAPNTVADTTGNFVPTGHIGAFTVDIDQTAPTAIANASDITVGGGATLSFTVTFSDNKGIDTSTIDAGDIGVIGPRFRQLRRHPRQRRRQHRRHASHRDFHRQRPRRGVGVGDQRHLPDRHRRHRRKRHQRQHGRWRQHRQLLRQRPASPGCDQSQRRGHRQRYHDPRRDHADNHRCPFRRSGHRCRDPRQR